MCRYTRWPKKVRRHYKECSNTGFVVERTVPYLDGRPHAHFQQDNACLHIARRTKNFFEELVLMLRHGHLISRI